MDINDNWKLVNTFLTFILENFHFKYEKTNAQEGRLPFYVEGYIAKINVYRVPPIPPDTPSELIYSKTNLTDLINIYLPADSVPMGISIDQMSIAHVSTILNNLLINTPAAIIPPVPVDVKDIPPAKRPDYIKKVEYERIMQNWASFLS